jgi:5'-3' exonuclease
VRFHTLLHQRLDAILQLTNPRKSVMLAIDGPAPLAKLMTQRERRKVSQRGCGPCRAGGRACPLRTVGGCD